MHCSSTNVSSTKTEKILSWVNDLHPDPNDPNNVSFFEALKVRKIKFSNQCFSNCIDCNNFFFFRVLMMKWFLK